MAAMVPAASGIRDRAGRVAVRNAVASRPAVSSRNGTGAATVNSHAPSGCASRLRVRDDVACSHPLARVSRARSARAGSSAVVAFS